MNKGLRRAQVRPSRVSVRSEKRNGKWRTSVTWGPDIVHTGLGQLSTGLQGEELPEVSQAEFAFINNARLMTSRSSVLDE